MLKAKVLVENLKKGLGIVSGTVATQSTLPVLGHIILESAGGAVVLKSGNIEAYTTCKVTAVVEEDGDVALPAKTLIDLVATYPDGAMTLDQELSGVRLKHRRRKPMVRGMPTSEFPILPQADGDPLAIFDPQELQEALVQVCVAAAVDWTRPVLAGVYFFFEGDALELVAADGFRLARKRMTVSDVDISENETMRLIIPVEWLGRLTKLLGEEEEPVHLYRCDQEGTLLFRLAGGADANEGAVFDIDVYMQSIEGQYIDYRKIVDGFSTYASKGTVSTDALIEASKSALVIARDEQNLIKVIMLPNTAPNTGEGVGGITILAQSAMLGDFEDLIDADVTHDGAVFLFNVRLFLDALNVIRSDKVTLGYVNEDCGIMISEVGHDDYMHILMTMMLKKWKG